jgi:tubulin-specific chaperone C
MDELVPSLRERKTELLDKRHQQRLKHLKNVQTLKNSEAATVEGIEYFETMFDTKIREIEFSLLNVQSPSECNGDKVQLSLAQNFEVISLSVLELQKYLSNSTFFLSDYKIKMCQQLINELLQKVEDKKTKLIPKKKFGFKKLKTPATINVHMNEKFAWKASNGGHHPVTKDLADNPSRIDLNKFEWTVSDRIKEIVTLEPDETNGKDVTLSNLQDCVIKINGHPGSLQISNIKNSLVLCGPVSRSIFADNCANCKFAFACQQLRLHTSQACEIYLYVSCRAIIEDSNRIVVAPFNFKYPGIDDDFNRANLELAKNNWADIADFNWLSRDKQSPNWSFMHNDKAITNWDKACEEFINRKIVAK